MSVTLENQFVKYIIGDDGRNLCFINKRSGIDYLAAEPPSRCARARKGGVAYEAKTVARAEGRLIVLFGDDIGKAVVNVTATQRHFVLEVESVSGDIEELAFVNLPTSLQAKDDESFSAGVLALNLRTNVEELPGPQRHLWAACYRRFGLAGARAGLIACPHGDMRDIMKELVAATPGVPQSPLVGPWALDSELPRGSVLPGNPTARTVGAWITLCQSLGFTQIEFCNCLRYGDYRPSPNLYPEGFRDVKAVVDKLHAAGIAAGLHTLSFSIDKDCEWVTPTPDPSLAKEKTYTLAEAIGVDDALVSLAEPTDDLPTHVNYLIRRSMTLQVDDELIEYTQVRPHAVAACKRGACGTRAAPHARGAKVHHLKECWSRFLPDGDSALFSEVASRTAAAINECGFDFAYFDGLDGAHVFGGEGDRWHYSAAFAYEVHRRLARPTMLEMATFHHHLWFVRSRMQAWDCSNRGHKKFIDLHCLSNEGCRRIFMPLHLGWTGLLPWVGQQREATFEDDVEYLWCKGMATDAGFSLPDVTPEMYASEPWLRHLAARVRDYETLRLEGYFPESIRQKLRKPGDEYSLRHAADGEWEFFPTQHASHKVEVVDAKPDVWLAHNKFGRQGLRLRIQALMSVGPYDAAGNITLADFHAAAEFSDRASTEVIMNSGKRYSYPAAAPGMTTELSPGHIHPMPGMGCGRWRITNGGAESSVPSSSPDDEFSLWDHGERAFQPRQASWARVGKEFSPPLELAGHQGIGVWIHGDGQGALLNFQLSSQFDIEAHSDHYALVDFMGWRYFEFVEPEAERFEDFSWPYGRSVYTQFREQLDFRKVSKLSLWCNNIPVGKTVVCHLSPIKALPLRESRVCHPTITIAGRTVAFPVEIETGCYLEFGGFSDCWLYSSKRELLREVRPEGDLPIMAPGDNELIFTCDGSACHPRANVTIMTKGDMALRR